MRGVSPIAVRVPWSRSSRTKNPTANPTMAGPNRTNVGENYEAVRDALIEIVAE